MKKIISYGKDAKNKLLTGITSLSRAVKVTLGGEGRNVIFDQKFGPPESTRDGVTVAKEFELSDPQEKQGANLLRSVALKTNENVGDGTSTAIVLAEALIKKGFEETTKNNISPVKLNKDLKKILPDIIKKLRDYSSKVTTKHQMAQIGTIASRDKDIGDLVADVISDTGKDGVIDVQKSRGITTTKEIVKGLKLEKGYLSPYFVTNPEKMVCEYKDIDILITDKKISNIENLIPLIEKLSKEGKSKLMIIADEVDGTALSSMVLNRINGKFKPLIVKAPKFGDNKREILQDIAIVTGGKLITEDKGLKLENVELNMLGKADKVSSNKSETAIVGGNGNKKSIDDRIKQIKALIKEVEKDFDKENYRKRLAGLVGGVAVIKVGATSEIEQKERKYRVEDAVAAVSSGISEGIIAGGGLPLLNIANKLKKNSSANRVLSYALSMPFKQILKNGGKKHSEILDKIKESRWSKGYDISNGKFGDMFEMGIIDPLKVTRTALENAISVASSVLITETTIVNVDDNMEPPAGAPAQGPPQIPMA